MKYDEFYPKYPSGSRRKIISLYRGHGSSYKKQLNEVAGKVSVNNRLLNISRKKKLLCSEDYFEQHKKINIS